MDPNAELTSSASARNTCKQSVYLPVYVCVYAGNDLTHLSTLASLAFTNVTKASVPNSGMSDEAGTAAQNTQI